jgi:hypothetical protein
MQLFVHKMADSECDADDLFLMPIIIPQLDLQAEFPDLDSENSEGEETARTSLEQILNRKFRKPKRQQTTSFLFRLNVGSIN